MTSTRTYERREPTHRRSRLRILIVALFLSICVLLAGLLGLSNWGSTAEGATRGGAMSHTESAPLSAPVQSQLHYVREHWNSYNTAQYGDMNDLGGDCANFVSQTLVARGWPMTKAWHNDGPGKDHTLSWGYVPSMDSYFAENSDRLGLEQFDLNDRSAVSVGDIAMFSWGGDSLDHVMVVTGVEHKQTDGDDHVEIYLSGHNLDQLDMSLDSILTRNQGASGHFWHLRQ